MRILFLTFYSPFHEVTGPISAGAEIAMRRIAEMLAERGHDVHYLSFSNEREQLGDTTIGGVKLHVRYRPDASEHIMGAAGMVRKCLRAIRVAIQNVPPLRRRKSIDKYYRKLNGLIDRFNYHCWGYKNIVDGLVTENDIQIVHCFTSMPDSLAAAMVCQRHNIPLTMRVGGRYWFLKYLRLPEGRKRYKYLSDLNYVFESTALFACNSNFIRRETEDLFGKLQLAAPAWEEIVDIGVRVPQVKVEADDFGIEEDDFVFASVGKFKHDSKRQDVLIKAFCNLRDYPRAKVVFAGDGDTREEMEHLAEIIGVRERVIFLGNIAHDQVFNLIRRSDVFVHPSDFEGSSKAVAEAMLCKKAIIASDIPAISEHIVHGENGLITKNIPFNMAEQMLRVLAEPGLKERMAEAAYAYANTNFNPQKNIVRYEQLFEQAISGKKGVEQKDLERKAA